MTEAWAIADSLATSLVSNALRDAIEKRKPDTKQLLHHSDRGCQISFALFFVAISSFIGGYIKDAIFTSKLELVDGVKQSEDEKKAL